MLLRVDTLIPSSTTRCAPRSDCNAGEAEVEYFRFIVMLLPLTKLSCFVISLFFRRATPPTAALPFITFLRHDVFATAMPRRADALF